MAYPAPLENLVEAFQRFPGIGRRSAERLAFHILRDERSRELAPAIEHAIRETLSCRHCCNVAEEDPCKLCADETRDESLLCVVEEPRHVEAFERSGAYRGRYHVLMGSLNPADGTESRHLALESLVRRTSSGVQSGALREIVLATDADAEGEATAALVLEALDVVVAEAPEGQAPIVSRLARGLPAGSAIEYLHRGVLEDALAGRRRVQVGRRD